MARFQRWIEELSMTRPLPAFVQGIVHLIVIYAVVQVCPPLLSNLTHNKVYPLLLRRPPDASSWQFFFSHLFVFSFWPALVVGFFNAKLLPHRIARFVWVMPAVILIVLFMLFASTDTGLFIENNIQAAFYYYFGGHFVIPAQYYTSHGVLKSFRQNPDFIRGWAQFRVTVPVYAGIAYSLGAWLSALLKRSKSRSSPTPTSVSPDSH